MTQIILSGVSLAVGVVALIMLVVVVLRYNRVLRQHMNDISTNTKVIESGIDAITKMREQMFLYESRLSQSNGHWVLEHHGEKKFFEPGRIVKVESGDEETEFSYDDKTVTCIESRNGKKVSSHVFTLAGAPVSGEIYEDGKRVRLFKYDELGQVCEVR